MGKLIVVTGGARSGKSTFAESLVEQLGAPDKIAYIATSQIYDEEMEYRVQLHRARRPSNWITYEAPVRAAEKIDEAFLSKDIILFDCITLYLSNLLCQSPEENLEEIFNDTTVEIQKLIDAVERAAATKTMVAVTNEVGSGIVPENKLARIYRDMAGTANQQLARSANEVYWVVAGIPVKIK